MRKDTRDLPLALKLDNGDYQKSWVDVQGKQQPVKEYMYWHKINVRCGSNYQKSRPSYKDYTISELFSNYNRFVEWYRSKPEFYNRGYVLDKDFLSKTYGTKEYSENTSVFIPQELNSFLIMKRINIKYYTGVSFQQECQKYIISCSQLNGKNKTLARVKCPVEGYSIYRAEKVRLAKLLAAEYKDKVDERVINILVDFENYIDLFTVNPTNKGETL